MKWPTANFYYNNKLIDMPVSRFGFGASSFAHAIQPYQVKQSVQVVEQALAAGINYFDVAPYYGHGRAERVLGEALKNIPRDQFFISSKVSRMQKYAFSCHGAAIIKSVETSLKSLSVEYLDIVFCHDVEFIDKRFVLHEILPALQQLRQQGKLKYIGVSAYPLEYLSTFSALPEVDVILSYCHHCLYNTRLLDYLPQFQQQQTAVINAAPFAMSLLTRAGAAAWHPATIEVKRHCQSIVASLMDQGVAIEHVCIQHDLRCQQLVSTLVGIQHSRQLQQIIHWIETPLSDDLINEVVNRFAAIKNYSWHSGKRSNNP